MEFTDLKEQTYQKSESQIRDYKKLLSFAGIGGKVHASMMLHLEDAEDIDGFYDAVFADDACLMENTWGQLARMRGGSWPDRFKPEWVLKGVRLQQRGIMVGDGNMEFYIPLIGRNRTVDVYLFADGGFNETAADYFTSISGTFTCLGQEFAGTYDVFVGPRLIIFERWEFDKLGNRLNGKGETKQCCSCR